MTIKGGHQSYLTRKVRTGIAAGLTMLSCDNKQQASMSVNRRVVGLSPRWGSFSDQQLDGSPRLACSGMPSHVMRVPEPHLCRASALRGAWACFGLEVSGATANHGGAVWALCGLLGGIGR